MNSVIISDSAIERIREIKEKKENHEKFLRISVLGGGCSGFQYVFELDDKILEGDIKIAEEKSQIFAITDETSLPFLDGAKVEFVKELGASYFKVNNPNAKASCGCGSSFSV
jgi:iron-sulfur cluster insertion protein